MSIQILINQPVVEDRITVTRICLHREAYIEPACCKSPATCLCQGRASVVCPASFCPGVSQLEADAMIARLQ